MTLLSRQYTCVGMHKHVHTHTHTLLYTHTQVSISRVPYSRLA